MIRLGFWSCAAVLALALAAGPANAAGFDCSKAEAPDERAVCGNPNLSALDSQMTGLWYAYSRVPMLMGGNGERQTEAQEFLTRRGKCGAAVECIAQAYNQRIAQLESDITTSMNSMAPFITGAGCPSD
jgi:uncharacterized protein